MWIKQSSWLLSHFECADLKNISKSIKKEKDSGITYAKEIRETHMFMIQLWVKLTAPPMFKPLLSIAIF